MGKPAPGIDYYSQHGIWGAYASLVIGRFGRGAGVVVGGVRPPDTSLYVGYRAGGERPLLLPFVTGRSFGLGAAAYAAEGPSARVDRGVARCRLLGAEEIERKLFLSGEEWRAGPLSFRVISFFGEVPDPAGVSGRAARSAFRPSILLRLGFDNTKGDLPMTGLFGAQGLDRPLSDSTKGRLLGMASGRSFGFAVRPGEGVEEVMDWSVAEAAFEGHRALRRLASEGGLRFRIEAGARAEFVLALGVYREAVVTSGLRARAYHSGLFCDLEDVLESALADEASSLAQAEAADRLLEDSGLSAQRRFILCHAAHSYLANTELLRSESDKPLFVVNEGEYRMMNTLDLAVDQAFWEARFSPWTLRNELESSEERSAYEDSLGLAFAHDQGVGGCFAPIGRSSYEMPGLAGCFSFMSYEETLNWTILACLYSRLSGDWAWAKSRRGRLSACLASLLARDSDGDGIMDRDSERCEGGAEITTYDSLDPSLGQARGSLYLAVKAWSAFVCLEALFRKLDGGASAESEASARAAASVAAAVCSRVLEPEGFLPALLAGENHARIIPAVEGLAYPGLCGACQALSPGGPYGDFLAALRRHLEAVLRPGICLDSVSGGWKLSSTSNNTWLSKVFLNEYVAERVLGIEDERTRRDEVHASWLRKGCADFAATDQVDSATGAPLGSRLYPRLVSSVLWLPPAAV